MKIQRYTCVLKKAGVLHVADGSSPMRTCYHVQIAAKKELHDSPCERVLCFHLDGANNVTGFEQVSQGGLHGAAILPRDILRGPLISGASAIILAHNHPSGNPIPSKEDVELTRAVQKAGTIVGIHLLDHIIVTRSDHWCSMEEKGMI